MTHSECSQDKCFWSFIDQRRFCRWSGFFRKSYCTPFVVKTIYNFPEGKRGEEERMANNFTVDTPAHNHTHSQKLFSWNGFKCAWEEARFDLLLGDLWRIQIIHEPATRILDIRTLHPWIANMREGQRERGRGRRVEMFNSSSTRQDRRLHTLTLTLIHTLEITITVGICISVTFWPFIYRMYF